MRVYCIVIVDTPLLIASISSAPTISAPTLRLRSKCGVVFLPYVCSLAYALDAWRGNLNFVSDKLSPRLCLRFLVLINCTVC
jgi:hypothetical protein